MVSSRDSRSDDIPYITIRILSFSFKLRRHATSERSLLIEFSLTGSDGAEKSEKPWDHVTGQSGNQD